MIVGGRVTTSIEEREKGVFVMTLVITDATTDDGGTYTCIASNTFGRAKANLKLDLSQGFRWLPSAVSIV